MLAALTLSGVVSGTLVARTMLRATTR